LFWVETPGLPVLNIEFVALLSVFISWKVVSGKSEYSLSEFTEVRVGLFNLVPEILGEFNFLSSEKDLGASIENSLWSTLQENAKVGIFSTFSIFSHISDEHVELNVRAEWNKAFSIFS
jgi:hypothetical protein